MSTLVDRRAGAREGEARKRDTTSLVERFKLAATRRIQRAFLVRLMVGGRATTDDIRDDPTLPVERDAGNGTWGAAVQGLVQARLIRRRGYVASSRPSRHGCPVGLWELRVEHAEALRWLRLHPVPLGTESDGEAPPAQANLF